MQPIKVNVCVGPFTDPNDFYFQWDYIFWWQMKFNFEVCARAVNKKIEKNINGDI